jgi:hypothetical protein
MTPQQRRTLAHALRIRFGTAPSEPTDAQLDAIVARIETIRESRTPTDADWRGAVFAECPSAGTHKYASLDNSDLNAILAQGTKQLGGR